METAAAAERFVRVWESGWATHDVDAILALYTEDCVHRSMPFRPPHVGRAALATYLRWSFAGELPLTVRFSAPLVGPGATAAAEFHVTAEESGPQGPRSTTLAGCVFVRFTAEGLAAETRDYWHTAPRREPASAHPFLLPARP
jgi:ketosteroid isomerase-like protein